MSDPARYVLRDLPGVADLEARLKRIEVDPSGAWSKLRDGLQRDVDTLSRRLFDLTDAETGHKADYSLSDADGRKSYDRWEQNFKCLYGGDDVLIFVLDAMGWDVVDEAGQVLRSFHYLDRQIVCVAKGLRGRAPPTDLQELELADVAEAWGDSLAEEAARFRARRR
jgi:hypothetical protein